jgi:hypothetical protein
VNADRLFATYSREVAGIALLLRKRLLARLSGITEQADAEAKVVGYSYGTGYKDLICTIILSKKGVKLGLYKGSELRDPGALADWLRQGSPVCRDQL